MITVLYDTPINLQNCNLPDIPNFSPVCLCESNFVWPERWRSQHFQCCSIAIKLAKKIPKLVIVTGFPLSSFKYLIYFCRIVLWLQGRVSGQWTFLVEILSFCCGRGGCHWHFLAPLTCVIPHADSCTIICAICQQHRNKFVFCNGWWLRWRARLQVHPQPAGVTSCMSFKNLCCFLVFFLSSNIHSGPIYLNFRTFSAIFKIFLNIRSPKTELLLNFLIQTYFFWCRATIFEKIPDVRSSHFASPFLMFHRTTARLCESQWSLW